MINLGSAISHSEETSAFILRNKIEFEIDKKVNYEHIKDIDVLWYGLQESVQQVITDSYDARNRL